jgi:hypothetical protein
MGSLDPYPDLQSGSESRRAKMAQKNRKKVIKISPFEVLAHCWMFSFEG